MWLLSAALAAGAAQRFDAGFFVFVWAAAMSVRVPARLRPSLLVFIPICFFYAYLTVATLCDDARWFDQHVRSEPIEIVGTVASCPVAVPYGVTFPFETSVDGRRIRLLVRCARFDVDVGDRLTLTARRVRPRHDMSAYLLAHRCAGIVRSRFSDIERMRGPDRGRVWHNLPARIHGQARRVLSAALGARAGLPIALVLGERGFVTRSVREQFERLGIAHLLALSGMHLGVLIALFVVVLRPLRHRSASVLPATIVGYLLVVGAIPSLSRATIMALLLILSRRLQRPPQPVHALGCALACMLCVSPELVYSVSFQLSFAAMTAVLLSGNRFIEPMVHLRGWGRRIVVGTWATLVTSCAVGVALVPLQARYFDAIPVAGPVATVMFFPAVAVILSGSLAVIALHRVVLIGGLMADLLGQVLALFGRYLSWAGASLPGPVSGVAPHPLLYLAALGVGFYYPRRRWGIPVAAAFAVLAFMPFGGR